MYGSRLRVWVVGAGVGYSLVCTYFPFEEERKVVEVCMRLHCFIILRRQYLASRGASVNLTVDEFCEDTTSADPDNFIQGLATVRVHNDQHTDLELVRNRCPASDANRTTFPVRSMTWAASAPHAASGFMKGMGLEKKEYFHFFV